MDESVWSRYEPTAARPRRGWNRNGLTDIEIVDLHGHAVSRRALEYVAASLPSSEPKPGLSPLADAVNALHDRDTRDLLADPRLRLASLDGMGIDRQVVWPTPHLHSYYSLPSEIAIRATQLANDGMAEFAAAAPDRLVAMGTVALQETQAAVAELERCARDLGMRGVQLLGTIAGREISEPEFEPFWAKAEELGMLVFIHGSGNSLGGRLKRHNLVNAIGNPLETTIALSFLISDGVLERHPRLKILAAHGGGFLGGYSGRGDHNWGARADGFNGLPHPPSFYLKRNVYFDSVVFTPHQLRYLVETYGAGHVVMGTDYPFNMGEFAPVEHIVNLEGVTDGDKRALLGGTAATLLEGDRPSI
jgi:aminocarboxymuconate-semialdehyde decarboxylase